MLFSWCKKSHTSWDPACGNKNVYFLRRETWFLSLRVRAVKFKLLCKGGVNTKSESD